MTSSTTIRRGATRWALKGWAIYAASFAFMAICVTTSGRMQAAAFATQIMCDLAALSCWGYVILRRLRGYDD